MATKSNRGRTDRVTGCLCGCKPTRVYWLPEVQKSVRVKIVGPGEREVSVLLAPGEPETTFRIFQVFGVWGDRGLVSLLGAINAMVRDIINRRSR